MKSALFVVAAVLSLGVAAQKNVSIHHSIDDNENRLSIKVNGTINGKPVDYDRTFDVTGMNREQRNAIKQRVYDSLGLPNPVAPAAPHTPRSPAAPRPAIEASPAPPVVSSKSQYTELYTIGGDHPYTKEIKYNPSNGLLFMKYRFIKNAEEITMEKSVDAKDKSKEERDLIIKKYEREIGILPPEII